MTCRERWAINVRPCNTASLRAMMATANLNMLSRCLHMSQIVAIGFGKADMPHAGWEATKTFVGGLGVSDLSEVNLCIVGCSASLRCMHRYDGWAQAGNPCCCAYLLKHALRSLARLYRYLRATSCFIIMRRSNQLVPLSLLTCLCMFRNYPVVQGCCLVGGLAAQN